MREGRKEEGDREMSKGWWLARAVALVCILTIYFVLKLIPALHRFTCYVHKQSLNVLLQQHYVLLHDLRLVDVKPEARQLLHNITRERADALRCQGPGIWGEIVNR